MMRGADYRLMQPISDSYSGHVITPSLLISAKVQMKHSLGCNEGFFSGNISGSEIQWATSYTNEHMNTTFLNEILLLLNFSVIWTRTQPTDFKHRPAFTPFGLCLVWIRVNFYSFDLFAFDLFGLVSRCKQKAKEILPEVCVGMKMSS